MIHINFRHHPNIIFMTDRLSIDKRPRLIPGIHSLFLQIHIVSTAWRDRIIKLKQVIFGESVNPNQIKQALTWFLRSWEALPKVRGSICFGTFLFQPFPLPPQHTLGDVMGLFHAVETLTVIPPWLTNPAKWVVAQCAEGETKGREEAGTG